MTPRHEPEVAPLVGAPRPDRGRDRRYITAAIAIVHVGKRTPDSVEALLALAFAAGIAARARPAAHRTMLRDAALRAFDDGAES